MKNSIRVLGIDLAFANMGFVRSQIDLNTLDISVESLHLVKTESLAGKTVRKNSDDLRRGKELYTNLVSQCKDSVIAIVEVPHGSQSARSSWGLGIAVGVLAACPIPIIQVTALQVKMASVGSKQASKLDMINWAVEKYPNAPWAKRKGKPILSNEHLADAIATLHAGILTEDFLQIKALMTNNLVSAKTRRVVLL